MTDEEIVEKIIKEDKEKFGMIMERYQKRLFGYLRNLTNQSQEEVEDILAEVFVGAYVNLRGFDTKKKFSSWIFRMAHNKGVDYFKKKKIKTTAIEENEELIGDGKKLFEEIEMEKERKTTVAEAVANLELKYREVILLYYFEEKDYEEISDILHIPTSNVGVLLYRGKEKLKKSISLNPSLTRGTK